ncbi:hypothetical protein [Neobacillus muris]|uniref:hypothetical protein n=1 Tax=Neobacillus muris TaxID=2941334 RepID=UPI00203AA1BD|nr:hypothetical protein [Neobacillus muris]
MRAFLFAFDNRKWKKGQIAEEGAEVSVPKEYDTEEYYWSTEAAEIVCVSVQMILVWCENGKYPGAKKTRNGNWRIPKKYFKI